MLLWTTNLQVTAQKWTSLMNPKQFQIRIPTELPMGTDLLALVQGLR